MSGGSIPPPASFFYRDVLQFDIAAAYIRVDKGLLMKELDKDKNERTLLECYEAFFSLYPELMKAYKDLFLKE